MVRYLLNGPTWRFGPVAPRSPGPPADDRAGAWWWRSARVPGHVQADLADHGLLPDVNRHDHVALYDEEANARDWWYERPVSLALRPRERAFLHFCGLDYVADIWWDALHVARHVGQFVDLWLELTHAVPRDGRRRHHTLGVRLWGAHAWPAPRWPLPDRLWRPLARRLMPGALRPYHPRLGLLRAQVSFGWDFAPACRAPGIWDDVWLVVSGDVLIRNAWVLGDPERPRLRLELDATFPHRVSLEAEWWEADGKSRGHVCADVEVRPGRQTVELHLPVRQPRLWWPWEHGRPHLYGLRVRVVEAGRVSDEQELTFGLRRVAWDGPRLSVNGVWTFIRGVNWVPASLLPGRLTRADYEPLLRRAREAGVNTVRVWGGGLREKRAFYELCDELGLLVWQDFPFACAFADRYPRDPAFLELAERTAVSTVKALRGHPSLVVWCAGNEYSPRRNRPLVARLARAVDEHDGTRPFRPPSPGPDESHNWDVWHGLAPVHAYADERAPLVSEFGLQALPARETLAAVEEEIWPAGPAWTRRCAEYAKLERYARAVDPDATRSLAAFVAASQRAQAWGLQLMVEHQRRRKAGGAAGLIVWQWNEPWPAITWALVDHFGRPKEAAEALAELYAPHFVTLAYPLRPYRAGDRVEAEIWAINDTRHPLAGAEARLYRGECCVTRAPVEVPAFGISLVATVTFTLRPPLTATLELWHGGRRVSRLCYDFGRFDAGRAPWKAWLRRRLAWVLERW